MLIQYDGGGEKDPRTHLLDKLGVGHEQKNMPQGCPDWVIGKDDDADAMVEVKWSRSDFVSSYERWTPRRAVTVWSSSFKTPIACCDGNSMVCGSI